MLGCFKERFSLLLAQKIFAPPQKKKKKIHIVYSNFIIPYSCALSKIDDAWCWLGPRSLALQRKMVAATMWLHDIMLIFIRAAFSLSHFTRKKFMHAQAHHCALLSDVFIDGGTLFRLQSWYHTAPVFETSLQLRVHIAQEIVWQRQNGPPYKMMSRKSNAKYTQENDFSIKM